jgi:hypothetical protein
MSIVATNTFISQNPGAIKAAIAMFSGPNQLFDSNAGGVAQNFLHTYPLYNMTTAQYTFFMSFSQWSPDGSMHTLEYQAAINTLYSYGVMTKNVTLSQAIDTQFVSSFP